MADNRPIDELFIEVNANDKTAQDSIDKLCKNLEKLQSVVSGLDKLEGFAKSVNALMKPFEKAKGQTNNLNEFTKGLRKLGNVGGQELDNAINNVERLYSSVSKFAEIPSEINSTIQALSKLASNTSKVNSVVNSVGKATAAKPAAAFGQESQSTPVASTLNNEVDATASKFDVFKTKIGAALGETGGKFATFAGKAKIAFDVVKKAVSTVTSKIANFVKKAVSSLKKIPSKIKEIGNHFKELVKKIIPAGEHMEEFSGTFKKLFSRIAVMGLLRRAFSQMLAAMKEGIQNVAKSVDSYNQSMSMIATSTNYAKNALAASLAPALNAIAPIIDKLVDKFVSLTEIFSQVVAKITGQSTFVKARKVQVNYAESLENAGKSASSANKALKEYQKTISAFDEANLIKTKQDTDTSGGAASSGGGYAFDEFKVADEGLVGKIGKMIDDIKAAFKRGDYYKAGEIFAKRLNKIIQKANNLDWKSINQKVSDVAHNISETINGIIENFDAKNMGAVLGKFLDTFLTFKINFTHNINWEALGAKTAGFVNKLRENFSPEKIGTVLVEGLSVINETLYGFFNGDEENERFNAEDFSQWLVDIVKGGLDAIEWNKVHDNIVSALSGLGTLLKTILTDSDLWFKVGDALNSVATGLIDGLSEAVSSFTDEDCEKLIDSIKELIKGLDIGEVLVKLHKLTLDIAELLTNLSATGVSRFVKWIYEKLTGKEMSDEYYEEMKATIKFALNFKFILPTKPLEIPDNLISKNLIPGNLTSALFSGFKESGKYSVDGLKEGITNGMSNISEFVKNIMTIPILNNFDIQWGIHSPSTVMIEKGKYIIDGLKNGIGDVWSKIKENFDNFKTRISNWFSTSANTFSSFGSDLVSSISSGIGDIWSKTKDKFNSFIDSIKNFFKGKDLFKVNVDWDTTSTVGRLLSEKGLPGIPKFSFFENGGFPDYGEMFVARENGIPEMVGKFGNRPAVANNDQIVAGISKGVYDAVVSAIGLTQGFSQNRDRTTNINLKVDKQTLASLVYDVDADIVRRKPAF